MPDLGILEILIAFFLFLPLTEDYIKTFHYVEGLAFFAPIAFFCALAIFPAYGLRIECIPLFIWTLIYNIINFPAFSALLNKRKFRDYSGRGNIYILIMILLTAGVTGIALYFLPVSDTHEFNIDTSFSRVDRANGNEYFVNVYNARNSAVDAETPLVIVVPPLLGSVAIVDGICGTLREGGVRVISFSRGNLDIPARENLTEDNSIKKIKTNYPGITLLKKYWKSTGSVWKNAEALEAAQFFETERMADIQFVLSFAARQFNSRNIYIAAYNEGASAAILLSASEDFINSHPELKGIIAIEGRIYTSYMALNRDVVPGGSGSGNFLNKWQGIWQNVQKFFRPDNKMIVVAPDKITRPRIPLLLLNSDRIETEKRTPGPYTAIDTLIKDRNSFVHSLTITGAGMYDYSDVPEKYPVISFFTRGVAQGTVKNSTMTDAVRRITADFIQETQP
jgi:hypothetical protein